LLNVFGMAPRGFPFSQSLFAGRDCYEMFLCGVITGIKTL